MTTMDSDVFYPSPEEYQNWVRRGRKYKLKLSNNYQAFKDDPSVIFFFV